MHVLRTNAPKISLGKQRAPKLHGDMLVLSSTRTRDCHWCPVKVLAKRDARKIKERRDQVNMRADAVHRLALRDSRAADEKRNTNIFVVAGRLAGPETVLTNMEPVVGREDHVGIVDGAALLQAINELVNHLVDALQRAQTLPVEVVLIVDDRLVLQGQVPDRADAGALGQSVRATPYPGVQSYVKRVEVCRPRDLDILKKVTVTRGRNGFRHPPAAGGGRVNVGMRRDGGDGQEERAITFQSIVQETEALLGDHVGGVLAGVALWRFMVSLVARVVVRVGVGVEEEVGAIESLHEGMVVRREAVGVHELAGVVGVVAGILHPDGEPVVVEALRDKLGISA